MQIMGQQEFLVLEKQISQDACIWAHYVHSAIVVWKDCHASPEVQ
jgi:hypothetical protein